MTRRAAAAAALVGLACFPTWSRVRTGAVLPDGAVGAIRDGATTRREVLDALGPPLVVVHARDGVAHLPDVGFRREGGSAAPAAWFYERFGARAPGPDDVVYYYRAHEVVTHGCGLAVYRDHLPLDSTEEHRDDKLWILLDGRTGVVAAHVHERSGWEPPPP